MEKRIAEANKAILNNRLSFLDNMIAENEQSRGDNAARNLEFLKMLREGTEQHLATL